MGVRQFDTVEGSKAYVQGVSSNYSVAKMSQKGCQEEKNKFSWYQKSILGVYILIEPLVSPVYS